MKITFFGTHNFAATILQGLIDNPLFNIELVITQPDKPVGRKKILTPPPVKILAEKYNIEIRQPENLKTFDFRLLTLDLAIVAQYGLLIPSSLLSQPEHGFINVHTSLLPKYRGASPIQSALINGETETGVTIMKMDKGLDTGPILLQKSLKIAPDDTYPTLEQKLAKIAILGLQEAIPAYISGKLQPELQNNSQTTICRELTREDGKIDWSKTAQEIYNLYRGLTSWPGIWTMLNNKRLKLLEIKPAVEKVESKKVKVENNRIFIGCSEGAIEVLKLQLEGGRPMNNSEFAKGYSKISQQTLE